MGRSWLVAVAVAALLPGAAYARDSKAALESAAAALGGEQVHSIRISGRGSDYLFGQAYDGDSAWPRFNLTRYVLAIDYTTPSIREERTRTQAQNPPLGGGNQPIGEQRQIAVLSGVYTWNVDEGGRATPAGPERDFRPGVISRQTQIWFTPQGFVKEALACHAAVTKQTAGVNTRTVVTFTAPNKVKLQGILNEQNLVEEVSTWLASPVLGDTKLEAVFEDYKDFGGVKFPSRIIEREGGYPILDITVTDVEANAVDPIEVPAKIKSFQAPDSEAVHPRSFLMVCGASRATAIRHPKALPWSFAITLS